MISLLVSGPPRAGSRPRFAKGRVYRDPRDEAARKAIQDEWMAAGRPRIDTTWEARIEATVPRPHSHWCKSGLSKAGKEQIVPPGDVDNYAKLCLDALVEVGAVSDDRSCIRLEISKRWADRDDPGETLIDIRPA